MHYTSLIPNALHEGTITTKQGQRDRQATGRRAPRAPPGLEGVGARLESEAQCNGRARSNCRQLKTLNMSEQKMINININYSTHIQLYLQTYLEEICLIVTKIQFQMCKTSPPPLFQHFFSANFIQDKLTDRVCIPVYDVHISKLLFQELVQKVQAVNLNVNLKGYIQYLVPEQFKIIYLSEILCIIGLAQILTFIQFTYPFESLRQIRVHDTFSQH
ncbi:Hypothetical_protein [Hexamita inflata]|uniref:Hypothetical_protein n=1 Tax=Hexamita inflata TaxID=28002 RepID=A0AA86TDU1_9EUKA|nr:Hypothetical protein HINF_LOCUS2655 [Hexamita inflata]